MKTPKVDSRYMARVYIQQARCTKWPQWRKTLTLWAIKNRTADRVRPAQSELFV